MLEQRMIVEETPEMDRFLRNFALPEKPHSLLPVVPRNLADISEVELMSLYSEFMSWVNYAKAQLVTAEIVEELLILLGQKGIQNLLVEGGGKTLGSFFDASQVDEIQVYIAPFIIGGSDAISPVGGVGILEMAQRRKIASFAHEMIDDNILLSGRLKHYESK